jgi:hypothetical protein
MLSTWPGVSVRRHFVALRHCHARAMTAGSSRSRTESANLRKSATVTRGRSVAASGCAISFSFTLPA